MEEIHRLVGFYQEEEGEGRLLMEGACGNLEENKEFLMHTLIDL